MSQCDMRQRRKPTTRRRDNHKPILITARITDAEACQLDTLARARQATRSSVIRHLIRDTMAPPDTTPDTTEIDDSCVISCDVSGKTGQKFRAGETDGDSCISRHK